jgi:hypothetical protein
MSFCNSLSSGQNYEDPFFIYVHCYRQLEAYYSRFILLHSSDILENVEYLKSNLFPSEEIGWDFIASLDERDLLRTVGSKEGSGQRGSWLWNLRVGVLMVLTPDSAEQVDACVLQWTCWSPVEAAARNAIQLRILIITLRISILVWYGYVSLSSELIRNSALLWLSNLSNCAFLY